MSFIIDVFLSLDTAYYEDDKLVLSHKMIVLHYLRTWFMVDLLSSFPFDHVAFLIYGESGSSLRSLKLLRVLRLSRLLKLLQLLRLRRRMNDIDSVNHSLIAFTQLMNLIGRILLMAHVLACGWFMVNSCDEDPSPDMITDLYWRKCGGMDVLSRYLASLYYTIVTMMAIGYGDITGDDNGERIYALFTQVLF